MVFCHTEVTDVKAQVSFLRFTLLEPFGAESRFSSQFLTCLPHALLGTMIWSIFYSLPYLAVSSIVVSLRAVLLSEALQPFLLLWSSSWFLLFLQQAAQIPFPEVFPSCGTQPCVPHIALQLSHGPQDTALSWSTGHACMSVCCLSDLLPVERHSESVT